MNTGTQPYRGVPWRDFFRVAGQDMIRKTADGVMVAQAGKHGLTPSANSLHGLLPEEVTQPVDVIEGSSMSSLSFFRSSGQLNLPVVAAAGLGVLLLIKAVK